jgi:hypothetical protein
MTRNGADHVSREPVVEVGVGDADVVGVGDGVGVTIIGVGVALGWKEDCAFGPEELPHAVRISTTARTAILM